MLLLMAGMLLLSLLLDVASGPSMLPLREVACRAELAAAVERGSDVIVWQIRLPVALMALLVGAALGLSGLVMQTVLHNPLASSYTLGVSAGAGFGAALVIVLGSGAAATGNHCRPAGRLPVCRHRLQRGAGHRPRQGRPGR